MFAWENKKLYWNFVRTFEKLCLCKGWFGRYLMELGALDLLDNGGRSISLTETYEKVASGKSGCCWELFDVEN